MRLWRICSRHEGERAFEGTEAPGRWSEPGTCLIYASESRALAVLDYAVHADGGDDDLVAVAADLPDAAVEAVRLEDLPPGWDAPEGPPELRRLGSEWAASGRSAVLAVPSAIVPGDQNLLLNPAHPDARDLSVRAIEPFRLDPRLVPGRPPRRGGKRAEIADGSERRLKREIVSVQRIGGLLSVAVAAAVFLGGIGIGYVTLRPSAQVLVIAVSLWALIAAALALVAFVWPGLAWARASFRVDDEGLEIRRGVWWREVLRVPRSRVQHTDVSQGPVERGFGLSTLVVHTAGTHHAAIHLEGLDHGTAEAVRDYLIAGTEDAV